MAKKRPPSTPKAAPEAGAATSPSGDADWKTLVKLGLSAGSAADVERMAALMAGAAAPPAAPASSPVSSGGAAEVASSGTTIPPAHTDTAAAAAAAAPETMKEAQGPAEQAQPPAAAATVAAKKAPKPHTKKARKALKLAALAQGQPENSPGKRPLSSVAAAAAEEEVDAANDGEAAAAQEATTPQPAAKKARQGTRAAARLREQTEFQKAHGIWVDDKCPPPFETFDEAEKEFGATLSDALRAQGYVKPTPIQAQAWPVALKGKDLVAVAKTGSGKTCGFILPALVKILAVGLAKKPKWISEYVSDPCRPTALVMAPTRELVQQIAGVSETFATAVGARSVAVFGGVPKGEQVRALRERVDILVATPGRLLDFSRGNEKANRHPLVSLQSVCYFVLDEADRMLDMGFEGDIRRLAKQCQTMGVRQTLFFTATWPKMVQACAQVLTRVDTVHIRVGQTDSEMTATSSVAQTVRVIEEDEKPTQLKKVLNAELKKGETAMVFASTKGTCEKLHKKVLAAVPDAWCEAIHKGKEQAERDKVLTAFRELTAKPAGRRAVLIATDVASRGLDIPGVALVVVYDFSCKTVGRTVAAKAYVHRIGRTGRAGKTGRAIAFFTPEDRGAHELREMLQGSGQAVPEKLHALADKAGPKNHLAGKTTADGKKIFREAAFKSKRFKFR
eukprot:TRINITY_DN24278_c0_g1_i1.p1 TRINITY_DN24278_c0_g1~~TRINITY_DN24278_c0_g1_i1.p1  ORF type:complete len:699 (+),score=187.79 TRINITY_DN24278_c0_g1_i1:69-2099(+)